MAKNHGQLIFQSADKAKAAITDAAKKDITKLYSDWADEIGKKAEYYKTKTTASSWLQEQNMRQLQAQLTATSKQISNEVYGIAKDSIYKVSDAVVQANNKWLIDLGFPADGVNSAFVSVPDQTVRRLITGQIYESGWSLSKSIWSDNEKTLQDIYGIVGKGLAQNMSVYDISKLLEGYVSPDKAKQWNRTMPDGVKIYKKSVDYNAQRLVRTLTQHGYQQSFIATTKDNPFVEYYIWRSNVSACLLCADRDGQHYAKDELPMDHPNGMCTMEPYVDDSKMIDQLADWVNSPDGTYPEIDEFAKQFGYESSVKESVKSNQSANTHHVVQGKDISTTWQRRPDKFDFEIEDVINAQGFDGLPSVVSADEFDKAVKESNIIMQRGYTAPSEEVLRQYQNELYNGKWYVDCSNGGSAYGKGMYSVYDKGTELSEESIRVGKRYGDGKNGIVETFTMTKDSKIILYEDAEKLAREYENMIEDKYGSFRKYKEELSKKSAISIKEKLSLDDMEYKYMLDRYFDVDMGDDVVKWYKSLSDVQKEEINNKIGDIATNAFRSIDKISKDVDVGSVCALKGYDAILIEREGYAVILNRTKVIFKGE